MPRPAASLFVAVALTAASSCGPAAGETHRPEAVAKRAAWQDAARLTDAAAAAPGDDAVLAVIFDEPIKGHLSSLGVFADGAAKMVATTGTGVDLPLEATGELMRKAARDLCAEAERLRKRFNGDAAPEPPRKGALRVVVVTKRGILSAEVAQTAMQDGTSPLASLAPGYMGLMKTFSALHRAGAR